MFDDLKTMYKETSLADVLMAILFVGAVVFADVLYIAFVSAYLSGALLMLALVGAFALGGSVILTTYQLTNGDIHKGNHRRIAITGLCIKFTIMALNSVIAFAGHEVDDQWLALYAKWFAPSTPIIVAAIYIAMRVTNPKSRAKQVQHEAEQMLEIGKIAIQTKIQQTTQRGMMEYLETDDAKNYIKAAANDQGMSLMRSLLQQSGIQHEQRKKPSLLETLARPSVSMSSVQAVDPKTLSQND